MPEASALWLEAHDAVGPSRDDMWDWLEERYQDAEARADQLHRERDEWERRVSRGASDAAAAADAAEKRAERAETALRQWRRIFPAHRYECMPLSKQGCTCGLSEAYRLTDKALVGSDEAARG